MKLLIYPTTRKVREFYANNLNKNALLDKVLSAGEFFGKIILNDKRKADDYETLLLMKKACDMTRSANSSDFAKLAIPSEFFTFLKNNEYLFSFFKELALSKKQISDLQKNDYYAQYDEHLAILNELQKNYFKCLKNANLHDDITLCGDYKINEDFLGEFSEIDFFLEGFLNEFELEILQNCTKFTRVNLHFKISKFNLSNFNHFAFFEDFELKISHSYTLNLNDKKIINCEEILPKTPEIKLKKFELRPLQAAFVFDEISNFIRAGIKPENIILITPDESFTEILRIFDTQNMLNFASGISIKESPFYQALNAVYKACKDENFTPNPQNKNEYFNDNKINFDINNSALKYFEVLNFYDFSQNFNEKISFEDFQNLISPLMKNEKNAELKIKIENEISFIKSLLKEHTLNLKEILELFFMRISNLKMSDTHGGAVTAMGLLESRSSNYEGVIIVDFNDEFVPKRSVNAMFLNNEVRKNAGLISSQMHENLQRFYYENLITNAKMVAISYVENELSYKSRFLKELNLKINEDEKVALKAYLRALNINKTPNEINLTPPQAPKFKYDIFEKPLSFSAFKLFLKHKRSYFYEYLYFENRGLKEPRNLNANYDAAALGDTLHKLLEDYYKENKTEFNYEKFIEMLEGSKLPRLDKALYKIRFKEFAKLEKAHFDKGWKVKNCELNFGLNDEKTGVCNECAIYEINNKKIKLKGKIDRVDEMGNELFVIDYKSGKVPESSYQLAFYQALLGQKCEAVFYDLKNMKKEIGKKTKTLDDLNAEFITLLEQDGEIEFENEKDNDYCAYKIFYEKDLR